jgi:hypothetical protein
MLAAMPFRRRLRTAALLAALAAASSVSAGRAQAQEPVPAPTSSDVAEARRHFEHAREEYGKGAYREAIGELEAAHSLDPTAKDLVFNLGVVHEKLSDIDEALGWFQLYTTMALTPTERERADSYIRRLEGAKKELASKTPPPSPTSQPVPPTAATAAPRTPASPPHGRVDAATIVAASVAGAALAFGVVMAAKAEVDRPIDGFVTGQDGTFTDFNDRTDFAHREAVVADIAFGASLAAGVTAAVLYFARTRDGARSLRSSGESAPATSRLPAGVGGLAGFAAAPLAGGGGALIVHGSL